MSSASPASAPVRLLLVDDDEDEHLIVRDLLCRAARERPALSYTLDWAATYEAGLEAIARGAHDVYLVDNRLGARSGLDLLREARAHGTRAPLILLTGQDDRAIDEAAMEAGAADYLPKDGLSAAILERTIRYAIAQAGAQESLRQAAAHLAQLDAAIENTGVGVFISQPRDSQPRDSQNGTAFPAEDAHAITFCNPAFALLAGYAANELIGRNPLFMQGPGTAPAFVRGLSEAMEQGRSFADVGLCYARDGRSFWADTQISPVRDAQGQVTAYIHMLHDVSAKIEADQALQESRENLEAAQKLTHLGAWSVELGAGGRERVFWSNEVFRILGLEPGQGTPSLEFYLSFVHPDDLVQARALHLAARRGADFETQYRLRRRDGEERWVQMRAARQDGAARIIGTILDVTSQRRAEAAARQSEARLGAVLNAAPLIIWAADEAGIYTLSQGRALDALDREQNEVVGRSLFQIFGAHSDAARMVRRALQGESGQASFEVDERIYEVHYGPSRDENGRINGAAGVSYDVTERIRAQRRLDETEARLARVVANVPGMVYRFHRSVAGKTSFSSVSEGCLEIYGVEPKAVLRDANVLLEVIHPDDLGAFFESVLASERDLSPWEWQGRVSHRSGEVRWIRGQARPARQSDGSTAWDGLVVDITPSYRAQEELLRSRRAFDEAEKLAQLGSFEWDLTQGQVQWSDQMFRLFGHEPGAFAPSYDSISEFIRADERQDVQEQSRRAIEMAWPAPITVRIQRADGVERALQTHSRFETDESGRVTRVVGSAQDVTDALEAQRALQESENRYALAALGAGAGLWDWNLLTGQLYLSPRWKTMLGYPVDASDNGREWVNRVHPDDIERVRTAFSAHLSGELPHFECEYRMRRADGSFAWVLGRGVAVMGQDGRAERIAGSQSDITERKRAEEQLSRNAFFDTLTELPNRALFLERLDRTLARAQRAPDYSFAVLFLDIDRFKKINDSLGHLPGDQLLIEAAKRFESCLRPGDTVARLGGDEFALLIDDIHDPEDVNLVAGRIQQALQAPFSLDGKEVFVTVSIGIAPSYGGQERADELLRNADTAMYRAKGLGRARHEVFDSAMHQRAMRMLELETDLWRAVERCELRLFYQPIVSLRDGGVCGFEALVRWQHPERGLISPGDFIPLAEETGLIAPLGWWVLEEACRQGQAWNQLWKPATPIMMSVNLSSKQFSQDDLIQRVQNIVGASSFDPHALKLEITESVLMENTESASAMLRQLKKMGIGLSMDDFGTGYSSLSYLHRFPLDTLKIDRSFISQIRPQGRNREIVRTILSLAHDLEMNVVAEGIETEEQLHALRRMNCGYAQGFFFAKPLPAAKVEELMACNPQW